MDSREGSCPPRISTAIEAPIKTKGAPWLRSAPHLLDTQLLTLLVAYCTTSWNDVEAVDPPEAPPTVMV